MIELTFNQNTIEYLLLILVRITAFMTTSPIFGDRAIPAKVKISISIWVTILMYYIMPEVAVEYATIIDFSILVVKEAITGLLIGFAAYICNTIIHFSGKIIDMEIGLSMAQVFDPSTNTSTGLTGSLYSYLLMLLMIVSNMHIFLINAIVDSYKLIPIGGVSMGSTMYDTVLGFMTNFIVIGFRIVLPVFAAILLLNCILGIMARVAPQMNMFAVGIQLKVMVGLFVIFVTISILPTLANFIFELMQDMVKEIIQGMI
ncbi:MAG: flagellar biosynthetic protein FliR [Lachnospiraceae bacterium]|nr:flagellar biosynthetic protein FliR [Lachnospiraceae bacterium]